MQVFRLALGAVVLMTSGAGIAAETIVYQYDARGRLTKVVHSGSVNNGLSSSYVFDKADNRLSVAVSGGTGTTVPSCMAVVPLGGMMRLILCGPVA